MLHLAYIGDLLKSQKENCYDPHCYQIVLA